MEKEDIAKRSSAGIKTALGRSFIITVIYIIFGCAWILLSDSIADIMIPERANLVMVSTVKGLVYVALTAALIFGLTYPAFKRVISAQRSLQKTNMELEQSNNELIGERNKLLASEASRKETEKSLFESQRSKAVLLENIPGMVYQCRYDRNWTMLYVSNGCLPLTGYTPSELIGSGKLTFNDLIIPKYREYLWNKWTVTLKQRTRFTDEYEIMTADGQTKWVWEQGQGVYDDRGDVLSIEGLIIDISDRKEQEYKLTYLSEHNEISGLFNRYKCEEVLPALLKQYEDSRRAFLLVSLKKLSLLSVTHGYRYSEMLIHEVAEKLQTISSGCCLLFHIANDRFSFYMTSYDGQPALIRFGEAILESLDEMLTANNVACSIGIVEIDDDRLEPASILKCASIAAEYKDPCQLKRVHVFNREMEEIIRRQEDIKDELSDCARREEDHRLCLEFQPIIHSKNGGIQGFEALARFTSEAYGRISPLEFIPIAEETQLIVPLGRKIMRDALMFLKKISDEGFYDIVMSVNVSAIQLLRDDFLPDLKAVLEETGATPFNVCIEITESYFSDNYLEINEKLSRVRSLGVSVALDDFGIGYSSLARERELHVDCLKIDKYFVDKLLLLGPNETITTDIISMAHKIGHCVVAEGVEEEKQRNYLLEHHCDYMQGYLFSKPLAPGDALMFLRNSGRSHL